MLTIRCSLELPLIPLMMGYRKKYKRDFVTYVYNTAAGYIGMSTRNNLPSIHPSSNNKIKVFHIFILRDNKNMMILCLLIDENNVTIIRV